MNFALRSCQYDYDTLRCRVAMMIHLKKFLNERNLHLAFEISLWLKGAFAFVEVGGGVIAYFVTKQFLVEVASAITQGELREDPRDIVAHALLYAAQHLSVTSQHFTAWYLASHGIIKLWLIGGLLRQKLWYYPLALGAFALFIVYQLYRFDTTHAWPLLVVTVIDIAVIALTWHEYRFLRRHVSHRA